LDWLWENSSISLQRGCCRAPIAKGLDGKQPQVLYGTKGGKPVKSGLATCHNIWRCPVCSPRINAARREEVTAILTTHVEQGGVIAFGTLTAQHKWDTPLADLQDAVTKAWSSLLASRAWKRWKKKAGLLGQLRLLEHTHGCHGWHPHLHFYALLTEELTAEELAAMKAEIVAVWQNRLAKRGYRADTKAQDLKLLALPDAIDRLAAYLTKAATELTGSLTKKGRRGSRTTWQILESAAAGNARDKRLWHEFEQAMKGKYQMTGLGECRRALGLTKTAEEVTDAEILAAEEPEAAWFVAINACSHYRLTRHGAWAVGALLNKLVSVPMSEIADWLKGLGVPATFPEHPWLNPPHPPPHPD